MKKNILFLAVALAFSGGAVGLGFIADHTHDQVKVDGQEVRNDHSGGTNSSGCHNDNVNGGYHCH